MTRDELLAKLRELARNPGKADPEVAHQNADEALLDYIADDEIAEAFDLISKWYA